MSSSSWSSSSSSITRKRKFSTMVSCTSRSSGLEYTTVRNKARKRDDDDDDDDDDYISRLPDVVLADILSLLPSTKEAVATSILSKRWRHVYTCVTRLHFDDSPVADCVRLPHMKSSFPFFTNFIDNVLLQASSHSNNDLTSFSLHFGKAHIDYYLRTRCTLACHPEVAPLRFDTWMSYPLTHRVRELDIYAHVRTPFNLPSALFTCPSLEVCKLDSNLHFQLPSSLCLPNLKELHLTLFSFPNDDSLTRLVSSCPSLEHLNLSSSLESLLTILFSSPSLLRLSILLPTGVELQRSKYILNVPNLEYLFCHELLALDGHGQLNALVEAQVSTFPMLHGKDFENMPDILSSLSNVECLFLMFGLLEALNFCDIKHKLSMFRNLKHLKLGCEDYLPLNTVLMELLRCAPLLETLTFPTGIAPFSEDDEDYEEMSERECQFWSTNDTVPSCVRSHLKRIVIMNFEGTEWELEIIKYFLKNTPVLEELAVSCSSSVPLADKLLLKSSLLELSRSSMTCSIKVD